MGEHTSAIMRGRAVLGYFVAMPIDDGALVRCDIMQALPVVLGDDCDTFSPVSWTAVPALDGGARLVDMAGRSVVVITCPEHAAKILARIHPASAVA